MRNAAAQVSFGLLALKIASSPYLTYPKGCEVVLAIGFVVGLTLVELPESRPWQQ
jgi:hypothetical protein